MQTSKNSAGLAFMLAADAGAPRTLGDRERIALLHDAMTMAINYRFRFDTEDAEALNKLRMRRCVGVFRPLDENYYRKACIVGGTYPRLWEDHHDQKPWIAEKRIVKMPQGYHMSPDGLNRLAAYQSRLESEKGRVCPGMGFLLPVAFLPESEEMEATLQSAQGMQLWWCTSFTKDTLNLCRYTRGPREHGESPVRKRRVTRAEWDAIQKSILEASAHVEEKAAA
ncbi:hypothetical protein LMG26857_03757 [Achromobacter anxifer]|uniref:hypothetical protein n=1 Tax=Achromobacter anxifer TaxID=1287737 RepID=UPI00155B6C49|nr:hypothetical protein [Achromobacter anxifer]CAB5514698.1 hypothetical protein LMG26857_03757 [Achromobacter anxifer]